MAKRIIVGLRKTGPGGKWWQARWTDDTGARRARGLGALSVKDAKLAARALEDELNGCRSAGLGELAPPLKAWLDTVAERRGHRGKANKELYETTAGHLVAFFGEQRRLDAIGPEDALRFVDHMRTLKVRGQPLAEQTIANHCRRACTTWSDALKAERIGGRNPWLAVHRGQLPVDEAWRYVSLAELERLLEHVRTPAIRIIVQLCRLAGLRRGEALALRWDAVDFDRRTLTIAHAGVRTSKKRARIVPLCPALATALLEAFDATPEGQATVSGRKNIYNLGRQLKAAAERAGLGGWGDPFQTLRRSCLTDWSKTLPLPDVAKIAGNSPAVVSKHYHQVRPEILEAVSGPATPARVELITLLEGLSAEQVAKILEQAKGIRSGYTEPAGDGAIGLPTA